MKHYCITKKDAHILTNFATGERAITALKLQFQREFGDIAKLGRYCGIGEESFFEIILEKEERIFLEAIEKKYNNTNLHIEENVGIFEKKDEVSNVAPVFKEIKSPRGFRWQKSQNGELHLFQLSLETQTALDPKSPYIRTLQEKFKKAHGIDLEIIVGDSKKVNIFEKQDNKKLRIFINYGLENLTIFDLYKEEIKNQNNTNENQDLAQAINCFKTNFLNRNIVVSDSSIVNGGEIYKKIEKTNNDTTEETLNTILEEMVLYSTTGHYGRPPENENEEEKESRIYESLIRMYYHPTKNTIKGTKDQRVRIACISARKIKIIENNILFGVEPIITRDFLQSFASFVQKIQIKQEYLTEESKKAILRTKLKNLKNREIQYFEEEIRKEKNSIATTHGQIKKIEENIKNAEKQIEVESENYLRLINKDPEELIKSIIKNIATIEKVDDAYIRNNSLIIITKPLIITPPGWSKEKAEKNKLTERDKKRKLGRIEIEIPASSSSLPIMQNLERRQDGSAHHPHIRPSPCWGNIESYVRSYMRNREYASLIILLLGYLETCNPDDTWGKTAVFYPEYI